MTAAAKPVRKLERSREIAGEHWVFRFQNGLVVHTDPFLTKDPNRVLPVGGPQDAIMSRLIALPEIVAGKSVFDACAGSGVLGLMALRLGAAHVDFLDISPRAELFQRENARRNGFSTERYTTSLLSLADLQVADAYDVVLCNPPFVPTPAGISGTVTSNGGAEGNDLVDLLLAGLPRWLRANGEAFICVMSFVVNGEPTIVASLERHLPGRFTELTPMQAEAMPFVHYSAAYRRCFPQRIAEVESWADGLLRKHGDSLALQHYVLHVQPAPSPAAGSPCWAIRENFADKYGQTPYPGVSNPDLALARAMENVLPG